MLTKKYKVLGVMSGTSLDGLDLAICEFIYNNHAWKYKIIQATTIPYTLNWKEQLHKSIYLHGRELIELDSYYGKFIGNNIKKFLKSNHHTIDFISSHGHTVFHDPKNGFTYQLGNGANIAAETAITTISNYRILDVALNGQGAPLVPTGDKLLFPEYDYCLNLGGFANISYTFHKKRVAFDICPVNTILNKVVGQLNALYDENGENGRKGKLNQTLLEQLNNIAFYKQKYPKSLGREWLDSEFWPILNKYHLKPIDTLRSFYEHIAFQITKVVQGKKEKKILVTGGGAHNGFLMELLTNSSVHQWIVPEAQIINYKEALIFAFLGVLRIRNENNCFSSVTGATHDSVGGTIFWV